MPGKDRDRIVRRHATFALAIVVAATSVVGPALAQDYPRRRTLLDMLFGSRSDDNRYERQYPAAPRPAGPRSRKKPAATAPTTPARPRPVPVSAPPQEAAPAKINNAQKILVVGDFFASAIGDGLQQAFADAPGTVIETRSNGSSGLVRDDYFDWRRQLPKMLEETKPALVIVELGANDRQQMTPGSGDQRFPSEAWFAEYQKRIDAIAKLVTAKKIPLIWVGLPPVKSPGMSADLIKFNALYRKAAEAAGGEFIDIWDGFVDADGGFVLTGSDINGQQARLRGPDGISMTDAGKRKMAFYLEKSARKFLGDMASPGLVRLDSTSMPDLTGPEQLDGPDRIPPMKISDPALDGADHLLGGAEKPAPQTPPSPRDLLVSTGIMPEAPKGRVDDYRLASPSNINLVVPRQ
ncbi:SGNH/GDSL hydrolase family protein [Agrobacterium vitis]|uniref:SGNH/GDSL hydrolase family protein n=1 Tax=Agrobacterium vitis TaxID=373 RepID=UPI003D2BEFEF